MKGNELSTRTNIWTEHEIARLKQLSGTMSSSEIGKILGRTKDAVKAQRNRWGLPSFIPAYARASEVVQAAPEPPKTSPVALRQAPKPPLRQKAVRIEGTVEYCPECHAPVSNWDDHFYRSGHKKRA